MSFHLFGRDVTGDGLSPFVRGFTSYGSTRSSYADFLRSCRKIGIACESVVASAHAPRQRGLKRRNRLVALFQDLPPDSPLLDNLLNTVIFPAWFHGVPLCFFSTADRSEYTSVNPGSGSLHTDIDRIVAFLHREQLVRILETGAVQGGARPEIVPPLSREPVCVPIDADLDPSQSVAARHGRGPMRVLAPAGSGKTKTLVNRICNLVNGGIEPGNILPLAFNRKAAAEMNERLTAKGLGCVRARTFHSLGYEIVRAGSRFTFDEEREDATTRELLKEALLSLHPAIPPAQGEGLGRIVQLTSRVKRDLLPLEGMHLSGSGGSFPFGPVFSRYLDIQEERGVMTYDDMIYRAVRLLLDNDLLRSHYQEEFTYLLVDEFQDLNRAQIFLLELLSLPENNLFVVGDDDQLIYGWRGANVRSIIDFPRIHPCAREVILSTNYRSSSGLVSHAGWLIRRNTERVPKSVHPRACAPRGEFTLFLGKGLWEQARSAAEWIAVKQETARWHDTAVLYRYNALRFIVALALDAKNIPHAVVDPVNLFDSPAGKDLTAWLTVTLAPDSARQDVLERTLRRPVRVLRRALIEPLGSWHDLEKLPGSGILTDDEERALGEFFVRVRGLALRAPFLSPHAFIEDLDGVIHLRSWYARRHNRSSDPEEADDGTYLDVLDSASRPFLSAAEFLGHIQSLHVAPPAPGSPSEPPPDRDEVVLSTVHRAKGNEFDRVVFFDLSRRHRPSRGEVEEERRVAYVALTRARDSLLVTSNGRRQSPFLREAALDPQFAGRMREDLQSELEGLRKRALRCGAPAGGAAMQKETMIFRVIDEIEEELRCRAMLSREPGCLD